jgi:hypothetical protein
MTNAARTAEELHAALVALVTRARSIDVRPFEGREAGAIIVRLAADVCALLSDAIAVCQEATSRYDGDDERFEVSLDAAFGPTGSDSGRFYFEVDAIVAGSDLVRRVADVAFFGATELRSKRVRLEHLRADMDGWDVVAECGSGVRRVVKSLSALEAALCEAERLPRQLGYASELSNSLEVRRQYTRLRAVVASGGEVDACSLVRHLRKAGTAIAMLIGRDIYPELRVHDRRRIRELQARILDWLRAEGRGEASVQDGLRLWQDLVGFAGLLAQVSRRQELVEHDTAVIDAALGRLCQGAALDEALRARLSALRGLDDELDAWLTEGSGDFGLLGRMLERLRQARGGRPAGDAGAVMAEQGGP